jgi:hypothetical protein
MRTIEFKVTDRDYEVIEEEATKHGVSINEVLHDWMLEGTPVSEERINRRDKFLMATLDAFWAGTPGPELPEPALSPEEKDALYAKEEHDEADWRALSEWHASLRTATVPYSNEGKRECMVSLPVPL